MTPSSLPPDDTSVNTKKVPESKQENKEASPDKSIPKNDPIPNLGLNLCYSAGSFVVFINF